MIELQKLITKARGLSTTRKREEVGGLPPTLPDGEGERTIEGKKKEERWCVARSSLTYGFYHKKKRRRERSTSVLPNDDHSQNIIGGQLIRGRR